MRSRKLYWNGADPATAAHVDRISARVSEGASGARRAYTLLGCPPYTAPLGKRAAGATLCRIDRKWKSSTTPITSYAVAESPAVSRAVVGFSNP